MVPVRRTQTWLPDIFNDFFDNTWMEKTNATAPAINIRETETNYEIEVAGSGYMKIHVSDSVPLLFYLLSVRVSFPY